MTDLRYVEQEIARLAYPATLPAPVRRILAQKYIDAQLDRHVDAAYVKPVVDVPIAELPEDAKRVLAACRHHHAMLEAAKKELTQMGFRAFGLHGDTICKDMPPAELERLKVAEAERVKNLNDNREANRRRFAALVKEIAAVIIKPVKVKLPADVLAKLEQFGTVAQLPEVTR